MKKFFKWFKRKFHSCSGSVIYRYDAATSYRGSRLGTAMINICRCDVCEKPFATLEMASGYTMNVSPSYAIRQALDAPMSAFKGREYGTLISMQLTWGL